ncbi:MAG: RNA chaperone Hfq [Firmicutes bacterium]|nr:RNA chaperone Hfq [Bacillota bacterium]
MSQPSSGRTVRIQQKSKVATIGWDRIVPPVENRTDFQPSGLDQSSLRRSSETSVSSPSASRRSFRAEPPFLPDDQRREAREGSPSVWDGPVTSGPGPGGGPARRPYDGTRPASGRYGGQGGGRERPTTPPSPAEAAGAPERPDQQRRPFRSLELQEEYFARLIQNRTRLRLVCFEGLVVEGYLKRTDTYGLLVETEEGEELIFKHGVIGILPLRNSTARDLRVETAAASPEQREDGKEETD